MAENLCFGKIKDVAVLIVTVLIAVIIRNLNMPLTTKSPCSPFLSGAYSPKLHIFRTIREALGQDILQYLKTASILSDAQHGFMSRRSCLTNLIVAEVLMTGMTDQDEPVDVVYLDFSKAFDSVCHRLLVKKMVTMGIHFKITG